MSDCEAMRNSGRCNRPSKAFTIKDSYDLKRPKKSVVSSRDSSAKPKALVWQMFADPAVIEQRMSLCRSCVELNSYDFCRSCWCYMPVKTRLAVVSCPLGKWPAESNYQER